MKDVVVTGGFDDLRSRHIRFLEEASRMGELHVLLWSDQTIKTAGGQGPKFPEKERLYLVQAVRYVSRVSLVTGSVGPDAMPEVPGVRPEAWIVGENEDSAGKKAFCKSRGIRYSVIKTEELKKFHAVPTITEEPPSSRKKVLVTGCYDWFHSGHVRFFEEVSELGDLFVVVGHDANVRLLKGEGHPLFPQEERRYMVQAVRYVRQALVSSGNGWLDAEPEIMKIKPDIYAVNEDGDKPEKKEFCRKMGIEYVVLKRLPKSGLPKRESTVFRGF